MDNKKRQIHLWTRGLTSKEIGHCTFVHFVATVGNIMREVPEEDERFVDVSITESDDGGGLCALLFKYCREETDEEFAARLQKEKEDWKRDPDKFLEDEILQFWFKRKQK